MAAWQFRWPLAAESYRAKIISMSSFPNAIFTLERTFLCTILFFFFFFKGVLQILHIIWTSHLAFEITWSQFATSTCSQWWWVHFYVKICRLCPPLKLKSWLRPYEPLQFQSTRSSHNTSLLKVSKTSFAIYANKRSFNYWSIILLKLL